MSGRGGGEGLQTAFDVVRNRSATRAVVGSTQVLPVDCGSTQMLKPHTHTELFRYSSRTHVIVDQLSYEQSCAGMKYGVLDVLVTSGAFPGGMS